MNHLPQLNHIRDLVKKAINKTATIDELDALLRWLSSEKALVHGDMVDQIVGLDWENYQGEKSITATQIDQMTDRILKGMTGVSDIDIDTAIDTEADTDTDKDANTNTCAISLKMTPLKQPISEKEKTTQAVNDNLKACPPDPVAEFVQSKVERSKAGEIETNAAAAEIDNNRVDLPDTESSPRRQIHFLWKAGRYPVWPKWVAAAVCVAGIAGLLYVFQKNEKDNDKLVGLRTNLTSEQKVAPGSDKALLILDDGKTIDLSGDNKGIVATEGSVQVQKVDAGKLVYTPADHSLQTTQRQTHMNTIATPRGGKYMAVLPDGTKVWLNAASSICFPTQFAGDTRLVSMKGEAYFEVSKDPNKPFVVQTQSDLRIRVYGTHFNINDYGHNGRTRTTLLEGAVKVSSGNKDLLLKPGQQAVAGHNGDLLLNKKVDLDEVIGWKNNLFYFKQANIKSIMSRISLWYDVDIRYKEGLPRDRFSAIISRYKSLPELLSILEETGKLHFEVDGKTITVSAR